MNEELKEMYLSLVAYADELKENLGLIEELLGTPQAAQFSEEATSALVDDILRHGMMINDIMKYIRRVVTHEIRGAVIDELKRSLLQSKGQL